MKPPTPLFWSSGDICSQARVDPFCMLSCLCDPQIHLWCDTCWRYGGQHGSQAFFIHVFADNLFWTYYWSSNMKLIPPFAFCGDVFKVWEWSLLAFWSHHTNFISLAELFSVNSHEISQDLNIHWVLIIRFEWDFERIGLKDIVILLTELTLNQEKKRKKTATPHEAICGFSFLDFTLLPFNTK